jgi:peptidoglycan/LPS O-acetylase OafA/YrhL
MPRFLCVWGYTAGAFAAGGLALTLWWLEDGDVLATTPFKPLATLGLWSYSIHLWHQPLCTHLLEEKLRLFVGGHVVSWSSSLYYPVAAFTYVTAAVGIGGMMYFVLERPCLFLRRTLFDADSRRATPLAAFTSPTPGLSASK